jgi:hypothetical protein
LVKQALLGPSYWTNKSGGYNEHIESKFMVAKCQHVVDRTFKPIATRDRGGKMPRRLKVTKVFRNESSAQWEQYISKMNKLVEARSSGGCEQLLPAPKTTVAMGSSDTVSQLRTDVNEMYLFHGTSPSASNSIKQGGFRIDLAGSSAGTAFGRGAYFAECSSKSDEYAEDDTSSVFTTEVLPCCFAESFVVT